MFSMAFLGTALSSVLVYIWSRRNPDTRLSFLGMFVFRAPYLPFVLMAFSIVLHNHIPKDEICGVVVGHGKPFGPGAVTTPYTDMVQSGGTSTTFSHAFTTAASPWIPHHGGFSSSKAANGQTQIRQ